MNKALNKNFLKILSQNFSLFSPVSLTPLINSANFWKNSKWSYWDTQGPGGYWFMKKTWSRLPLKKTEGTNKTRWDAMIWGHMLQWDNLNMDHMKIGTTWNGTTKPRARCGCENVPAVFNSPCMLYVIPSIIYSWTKYSFWGNGLVSIVFIIFLNTMSLFFPYMTKIDGRR